MAEETKTETTSDTEMTSSFGDALKAAQTNAPETPVTAPAATDEPEAPAIPPEVKTETPAVATAAPDAPVTPPAAVTNPEDAFKREVEGLRGAMLAERRKAQELAQRLAQYETTETPYGAETEAQTAMPSGDARLLKMAEVQARQMYPDFDEKYQAFVKAALEDQDPNKTFYRSIVNAEHPGIEAYRAGKKLLFAQKYGVEALEDPDRMRSALEKELAPELEKKIRAELEQKILGVASERANQPTNISTGRAPGKSQDTVHTPLSFGDALRKAASPQRR